MKTNDNRVILAVLVVMDAAVFELAAETSVRKMMLEKVSGCALIAIWLLAMAAESGIEVKFG